MQTTLVVLLSAALLTTLTACALLTPIAAPKHDPAKVACESFRLITFDRLTDTDETIRQVKGHNAAYRALCTKPMEPVPE